MSLSIDFPRGTALSLLKFLQNKILKIRLFNNNLIQKQLDIIPFNYQKIRTELKLYKLAFSIYKSKLTTLTEKMKKIIHTYSLTPEWQKKFVEEIQGELIDNKITIIPESLGHGSYYFTEITPFLSAIYIDITMTKQVKIIRESCDEEFYIFHYDLSNELNLIKIDNIDYVIGTKDNYGIMIVDNKIESAFKPALGKRTTALRLLVDKVTMDCYLDGQSIGEYSNEKGKISKKSFSYYNEMDSKSRLLLQSILNESVFSPGFDAYLKGISLKLLGIFLLRYENFKIITTKISKSESKAILKAKNYLLNNLYEPFPSILTLAAISGMSVTKFKVLFKKYLQITPKKLFVKEKFILAEKLLKSGEFNSISEIMLELNYTKLSYFRDAYFEHFKRNPSQDFVKKVVNKETETNSV